MKKRCVLLLLLLVIIASLLTGCRNQTELEDIDAAILDIKNEYETKITESTVLLDETSTEEDSKSDTETTLESSAESENIPSFEYPDFEAVNNDKVWNEKEALENFDENRADWYKLLRIMYWYVYPDSEEYCTDVVMRLQEYMTTEQYNDSWSLAEVVEQIYSGEGDSEEIATHEETYTDMRVESFLYDAGAITCTVSNEGINYSYQFVFDEQYNICEIKEITE